MKNNISNLYFAKIRSCIMDLIMDFELDGKKIVPRPDYYEFYAILLQKEEKKFINIFDPKRKLKMEINSTDLTFYDGDLIIELEPLINYIDAKEKFSNKELGLVYDVIAKTKKLKPEFGYIDYKTYKK